jgi:AmmeMemoRadiSam system protein A
MELSPSMNGIDRDLDPWTAERGLLLLRIARESVAEALGLCAAGSYDAPWLHESGACFVTLFRRGDLRGCVGSVRAYRRLFEDVWSNARASAFHDSRFPPVRSQELPEISVEISLLSAPEALCYESEEEALRLLCPGLDGIILEAGACRGTFLPQVWEQLPEPRDFLLHLKRKAGLPLSFWSPEVQLYRYRVRKWGEDSAARRGQRPV